MGQNGRLIFRHLFRFHDDPKLTACLDSIAAVHTGEGLGNIFQLGEPFDIVFQSLAAGAGAGCRHGIRCCHQYGFYAGRLRVSVVGSNGIDDFRRFMVFLCQFNAQFHMGAFLFTVHGFADIVQEACPFGQFHIGPHFAGHNACKVGCINTVLQHILSIACPVFQTAQDFYQFRIHAPDTALHNSLFTGFADSLIHIFLCLGHHFFNPCRMDSSILHKAFQCQPCHLTADRIEAGKNDRFRRIINDQIHTGQGFNGPDITAFPADNAAFHFFIRKGNDGNRGFGNRIRRIPLNGGSDDFPGLGICCILGFFHSTADADRLFMGQLFIHSGQDHISGLIAGKLGNFFQFFLLLFIETIQLFLLGLYLVFLFVQLGFPLFQVAASPVQIIFLLHKTLFVLLQFITALFVFLFHIFTKFVDFFTGLYNGFLLQRFRFPRSIIQHFFCFFTNLPGLFFCRSDSCLCNALAEHIPHTGTNSSGNDTSYDDIQ